MTFCCKLLLTPLPAEAANVVGTFTKKLMLRFLFFIELNNDFGVVDDSCIGVGGGGGPITEIPVLRSTGATVKTDIPAVPGLWSPVSICRVWSPDSGIEFLERKRKKRIAIKIIVTNNSLRINLNIIPI